MNSFLLLACCIAVTICIGRSHFDSESELQLKILQKIASFELAQIPPSKRSLAIYYVANPTPDVDSVGIVENNVRIFAGAVRSHSQDAPHQAFYVFCVVAGNDNVLSKHLPTDSPNAAFVSVSSAHGGDLASHVHMVALLGDNIISKFHSVLFVNQDARGPFIDRTNGAWWGHFISKMNERPSMVLVGPMISCEIAPHVQTHAFAMRSDAVMEILSEFNPRSAAGKRNKAKQLETALSTEALSAGYEIASIYYHKHLNKTVFDGKCVSKPGNALYKSNPTSWCGVQPRDAVFMKWGGHPLRIRGYFCQDTIDAIKAETLLIAEHDRGLGLDLPETLYGGKVHALHKEYDHEIDLDRTVQMVAAKKSPPPPVTNSKVCFIVRTTTIHGRAASRNTRQVPMELNTLIQSLLRQSDPNWEAYFVISDEQPFEKELQNILRRHGDARLTFLNIDKKYRPKFTPRDAGYKATDAAIKIVQNYAQCKWLSSTNGDNIYGSNVVNSVLTSPKYYGETNYDAVLVPLDSRNYAEQDYRRKRGALGREDAWDLHCTFLEAELERTRYGYAMTPWANLGGLDLASLFMEKKKFVDTGVYFSDFTEPAAKFPCEGCQDGYFMNEVRHKRNWTYHRMGMHGFNSLIFHGPSPLWCIAAGNVWFDHPQKTVCMSHKTVGHLYPNEWYDWKSFYQPHAHRVCLRLSETGFGNSTAAMIV